MRKIWGITKNILFLFFLSFAFISCDLETKAKVSTVKFDANGASGTPPAPITVEDVNYESHWNMIKLPDKGNLNYEGKQFYGWNTSPNGTGKYYSAGSYFMVSFYVSSIVLYAQWEQFLAPGNLRFTNINQLEWDAPEGYEDLSNYGSDGDTRVCYLLFRRPVESTGNFSFYGYTQNRSASFSVHDYNWGTFEFFVALGVITFSYYEGLADGIFILNYENNYTIKPGPHSNVVTARIYSTSEVLPAPTGLHIEVLDQYSAKITWEPVWPTTVYRIYRSYNGYIWEEYRFILQATEYTVTQKAGSTVYYRILALNSTLLTEGMPVEFSVTTPGGTPNIPTGITALSLSSTSISLSWNESERATAYEIYYSIGNSGKKYLADTVIGTNYIHTGLTANTNYYYYINAINNEFNFTYSSGDSNSVLCSTPTSSASTAPTMLIITNNTSCHLKSIHINNGSNLLTANLNKNTSIQFQLNTGTYTISLNDTEGRYMTFPVTIGNGTVRRSILDSDWPSYAITLKNNYSYAIAGAYLKKAYTGDWGTNKLNSAIVTNNSFLIGKFEQNPYEVMAESQEYYRISTNTNDSGVTISGGVLDGYRPVWYVAPIFTLNEDITVTAPATGWVKIKPE
jgi:hypothetical protein